MNADTPPRFGAKLLRGFARLPRLRRLTFVRNGLEIYASGAVADGRVVNLIVEDEAQMDLAWAKRRRNAAPAARPAAAPIWIGGHLRAGQPLLLVWDPRSIVTS